MNENVRSMVVYGSIIIRVLYIFFNYYLEFRVCLTCYLECVLKSTGKRSE